MIKIMGMSIYEIIEKINTDKREIAFSRWKGNVVIFMCMLLFLLEGGILTYIFLRFM